MEPDKEEGRPEERKKPEVTLKEEEILTFWKEQKIFEKTLEKKSPKGEFVFYDGPPFATGLPHYGHVLPGTIKDAIPRYKTMQGYHVRRQWGWDCHGLPIENLVEKELELRTKKDIEQFGIDKFNEHAQSIVLRYADDWKKIIPRTGRWIDMERDYRTMDATYTESVWSVFKTLYDKGLIYEGFKSMHICPRCETTLSNFEVSQGYKEVTDISVTVKFFLAGDPSTALLVWTTTPWTLPGNAAVAVNKEFDYVKIKITNQELRKDEQYILAKKRLETIKADYEVIEEFKGERLAGRKYTPIFDYYMESKEIGGNQNNWKVYGAHFVKSDEGTGIVHIAPAFGEDDMNVGREHTLSLIQHVGMDGRFKGEVVDFSGMKVKPKDDPQETDVLIIKYLAKQNLLFAKEKIKHAYPHCWRCDTPLLNYAANSWFVKVTAIKEKIIKANKKIKWVPEEIGSGRFEKGLLGAPDWAMSRSRFWGAPLPVWKCSSCNRPEVVGSIPELKGKIKKSGNTYFMMRHGEARNNIECVVNGEPGRGYLLTVKGKIEALRGAEFLKEQGIDLIFASPLERTRETALIVAKEIGLHESAVIVAPDLREIGMGVFEGKSIDEYNAFFPTFKDRFEKVPEGGENWNNVKRRMTSFLYEIDGKYKNKKILIVSHEGPLWMLDSGMRGLSHSQAQLLGEKKAFIETAEARELHFSTTPHNKNFELDLHRPYIDEITFSCSCGGIFRRIPDVFDCWFESGAMPYAQHQYVFDEKKHSTTKDKKEFPADFIAESLDQTRGWFYSLLVLGAALFGESPYKNVVVSGLVLGEDGRKMSKKLKNYPELSYMLDQYGADALRYYLLSSPLVRADTINFSEQGIKEIQSKIINRLRNVVSFYEMYVGEESQTTNKEAEASTNILDQWILIRLKEVSNKVLYGFEHYELDKAVRPIGIFIEDLSLWYIRRSRSRFKSGNLEDRKNVAKTTRYVLKEFAKIIAPSMPFIAEEVYRAMRKSTDKESVHLEDWPQGERRIPTWPNPMAFFHRIFGTDKDLNVLTNMEKIRKIVSLALERRTEAGIRVRQPLLELRIKSKELRIKENLELVHIIEEEVNVKKIVFGADIENDVELDLTITRELKEEGILRELLRSIQDLRKKEGFKPHEKVKLFLEAGQRSDEFIRAHEEDLKKGATLSDVVRSSNGEGEQVVIDTLTFIIRLERA